MRRNSDWVNLQDYLGLNQEQGEEMGNRVYNDVEAGAQQAGRAIGNASTKFQYGADTGTLRGPDENAFNQSSNVYTSGQAGQKAQAGYSGPQSLADVDANLGTTVGDAVQRVQNAQTQGGIGQELQKSYGDKAATGTGGSALDSFLTGATSSARLSGLQTSYGGMMGTLDATDADAAKRAAAATAKSKVAASRWADLTPVLKENEAKAAEATAAGDRAMQKLLYDIDQQQEMQYGRGTNFTDHRSLQDSVHAEDPRLRAYKEGWGEKYDKEHPPDSSTGKQDEGYTPGPAEQEFNDQQRKERMSSMGDIDRIGKHKVWN